MEKVWKLLLIYDFDISRNGGIENHLRHIIRHLNKERGLHTEILIGENLAGFKLLGKNVRSYRALKAAISKASPDIIHIHGFASVFVTQAIYAARSLRIRTIYTPHFHPFSTLNRPLIGKLVYHIFQKRAIKMVQAVIVLTDVEQAFFCRLLDTARIHKIPNGITLSFKKTEKPVRERSLLFIGRDDTNKRFDFLRGQKNFFLKENIVVRAILDTHRPDNHPFYYYSKLSPEQLADQYISAGVVVIPSRYEAFSLVALEALSANTPVLASENVQIKEYLNGCPLFDTFDINDVATFQRKLLAFLDLDQSFRQVDTGVLLEQFTWEGIIPKLINVYLPS